MGYTTIHMYLQMHRTPNSLRVGRVTGSRTVRGFPVKHSFEADVFVEFGPMNSLASADKAEVRPLRGRGFGQPP